MSLLRRVSSRGIPLPCRRRRGGARSRTWRSPSAAREGRSCRAGRGEYFTCSRRDPPHANLGVPRRNMGDLPSNRPPPAASGTLAKTPFLHLLIYAFEKKLGGTIEVAAPDGRVVSVLFVGGEPAKA